ncbi:unnamed protein product [Adineta steineri]|uniref:Peptidase C1A papain C-terminal domain-containing protein n=1 Tax=Adineta steineri TaxID=433720 RepID=A0A816B3F7_9BILA|nr:unnamed protein product [Adineta steineri]CAF1605027.1 unnamed protein product [Adineta steineri]
MASNRPTTTKHMGAGREKPPPPPIIKKTTKDAGKGKGKPPAPPPIIKKMFLHNHKTNKRYRVNGDKESSRKPAKDSLHKDFSQYMMYAAPQLPNKVDLRPWMTLIEDQSDTNSCTANAMAGIYEYLNYRITGRLEDVSRLFIYYNSRIIDNEGDSDITDEGATIASTIESVSERGVCLEYLWPYNTKMVNTKPNQMCYAVAPQYSISEALEIDVNLNEMKCCLAQGFPMLVSLNLYKSFDKGGEHGVVPMPKSTEVGRSSHARHCVVVAGYSDHSRAFIVRNSWGSTWGDRGYCYIPYDYLGSTDLCNSAWTVKNLGIAKMTQEGWQEDDEVDYLDDGDEEEDDDDDDEDADFEEEEDEDEPDYDDEDDDDEE